MNWVLITAAKVLAGVILTECLRCAKHCSKNLTWSLSHTSSKPFADQGSEAQGGSAPFHTAEGVGIQQNGLTGGLGESGVDTHSFQDRWCCSSSAGGEDTRWGCDTGAGWALPARLRPCAGSLGSTPTAPSLCASVLGGQMLRCDLRNWSWESCPCSNPALGPSAGSWPLWAPVSSL